MTLKLALTIIIPVLEKVITQMSLANQTPEQRVGFNRLKAAVKFLKTQVKEKNRE